MVCGSLEEITQSKETQRRLEIESIPIPNLRNGSTTPNTFDFKEINESKTRIQIIHSGNREEIPKILSQMIKLGGSQLLTTRKSKVEDLFLEIESGSSSFDQDS